MRSLLSLAALLAVTFTLPVVSHADELPRGVLPIVQANGHRYVTLRAAPSESWARGGVRLVRRELPAVAVRNVRLSALPREVREDARGTLRVHNAGGEVCQARMARPVLLRHAIPAFEYDDWEGANGQPRLSDREVARALWDITGSSILVARLIPSRGNCRMGTWASRGPLTFGTSTADIPEPVLAAFRSVQAYEWLAESWEFVREGEGPAPAEDWDARPEAGRMMTSLRIGSREFRLVGASADGGCGDFTGGAWALLELSDAGAVVLQHGGDVDPPYALADLDGDGVPEAIGRERARFSTTGETVSVAAPFFGCPC